MGIKVIPLYISDNLDALKALVNDDAVKAVKNLRKLDRLPRAAQNLLSQLLQLQNDQEKCYILGRRYLNLMDYLFKMSPEKDFLDICYRGDYRKVQNVVKELEIELEARYEELEKSKIEAKNLKNKNELDLTSQIKSLEKMTVSDPIYIKPNIGDGTHTGQPPIFESTYITPSELYNAFIKEENLLIVDIRPKVDYEESRIQTTNVKGDIINIPEDILDLGLSANTLGQRLSGENKAIWEKRDKYDAIVLLDWDTDDVNYSGTKLERLRVYIVEWDFNRKYRQEPVVLSGGFREFLEWYPTEVTNNDAFLTHTNSEMDELLAIDDVSYPETGTSQDMNLKVHMVTSFGDIEDRLKQDFDEEPSLPGAKASKSEGELPKHCYSSDENISTFKSISEEDIPKPYISEESLIIEPPLPILMKTEPTVVKDKEDREDDRGEDKNEKDIQIDKDRVVQIRRAIEGDRAELLNKARALKPKTEDSSKVSQRTVIIRNLIEENKDMFKPPSVDRTFKPMPKPVRRVSVADGYTGISNLKNNCYMSAILQCLKVVPLIKSMFVTSNSYERHIQRHPSVITKQFAMAMRALWEGTVKTPKVHYPYPFMEKIYDLNPGYYRGNHEDAFEFFLFLFNYLSDDCSIELQRPKIMTEKQKSWYGALQGRSSYFVDTFYFQLRNTKVCWHCNKANHTFETESTLMLPVPERSTTLENLIAEYMKDNLFPEYVCCTCKSSATIVNKKAIVLDPEVLVIVLKRYMVDGGTFRKNEVDIDFPMNNLVFGKSKYRLYAVPQHQGSMTAGHYFATILLNDSTNTWVLVNDEKVQRCFGSLSNIPGMKSQCVGFFYIRQKKIEIDCDT